MSSSTPPASNGGGGGASSDILDVAVDLPSLSPAEIGEMIDAASSASSASSSSLLSSSPSPSPSSLPSPALSSPSIPPPSPSPSPSRAAAYNSPSLPNCDDSDDVDVDDEDDDDVDVNEPLEVDYGDEEEYVDDDGWRRTGRLGGGARSHPAEGEEGGEDIDDDERGVEEFNLSLRTGAIMASYRDFISDIGGGGGRGGYGGGDDVEAGRPTSSAARVWGDVFGRGGPPPVVADHPGAVAAGPPANPFLQYASAAARRIGSRGGTTSSNSNAANSNAACAGANANDELDDVEIHGDDLNARAGRAGWNVYRREVVMPERERHREREVEGRRDSSMCSIANPRMNSVCKYGCAIC